MHVVLKIHSVLLRHVFIMFVYCMTSTKHGSTLFTCLDISKAYLGLVGLVLWCLMPLSTIFQLYRGSQCYCWRKLEYPEKTTDLL